MQFTRVLGIVMLTAGVTAAEDSPFKFKAKEGEDVVTAKVEKDRTLIDVKSPRGISELTVERTGEAWPEVVVVRLHLSGLEKLRAKSEKVTLEGSVLSHTDYAVSLSIEGKKADPKDAKGEYFMDFKMVGKDGKAAATIPIQDGYFEFRLPKPFFESNPKSIAMEWIDYYRR